MATASDAAVQANVGFLGNRGSGLRVLEAWKMTRSRHGRMDAVGTIIAERPRTEPYVRLSRIRLTPRATAMRSERGR